MVDDYKTLGHKLRQQWVEERRYFDLRTQGRHSGWGSTHIAQWDGGISKTGKHYNNAWTSLAEYCVENSLDPVLLIRALFHYAVAGENVYPNQLKSELAKGRYYKYTAASTQLDIKNELTHKFESQKTLATSNVMRLTEYNNKSSVVAWRLTIADDAEALTPLFRYCVAYNQGWHDLAELYLQNAKYQYARCPEIYNDVWGNWIPDSLKAEYKNAV